MKKQELEVYRRLFGSNEFKVRISDSNGILMSHGSSIGFFPVSEKSWSCGNLLCLGMDQNQPFWNQDDNISKEEISELKKHPDTPIYFLPKRLLSPSWTSPSPAIK